MLQVELDLNRIARQQQLYTEKNLISGRNLAVKVMQFRKALEHDARRFNERQTQNAAQGRPFLCDGQMSTLQRFVVRGTGDPSWPRRMAAMLRGLHTDRFIELPTLRHGSGRAVPSQSWVARLDDAPHDARDFPTVTAIAAYFDPLLKIRIFWIGANDDLLPMLRLLAHETQAWHDWSSVYPPYHATAAGPDRASEP